MRKEEARESELFAFSLICSTKKGIPRMMIHCLLFSLWFNNPNLRSSKVPIWSKEGFPRNLQSACVRMNRVHPTKILMATNPAWRISFLMCFCGRPGIKSLTRVSRTTRINECTCSKAILCVMIRPIACHRWSFVASTLETSVRRFW
jgi:hypothetical protein